MMSAVLLACALTVAPATMDAVIRVESGGNPYAMHVNRLPGLQPHADTMKQAVEVAKSYIDAGFSVDLGLSQLNSANLARFGYSVADAFDPCRNVAAGGAVLSAFYAKAVPVYGEGQRALRAALSAYNTGDLQRGFANGYVGRYYVNVPAALPPVLTGPAAIPPAPSMLVYTRPGLDVR